MNSVHYQKGLKNVFKMYLGPNPGQLLVQKTFLLVLVSKKVCHNLHQGCWRHASTPVSNFGSKIGPIISVLLVLINALNIFVHLIKK